MKDRTEHDAMGEVEVPGEAYFGAQTQRAAENFPVSGLTLQPVFLRSLALIKRCAAQTNSSLGRLARELAGPVIQAAREVYAGRHMDQFIVDVFQTGSGTSTNMNMNEVLAGRANEIISGTRGGKSPVHPNDHVNMGQSSNDVFPSAIHIAAVTALQTDLLPALELLRESLSRKADDFADIRKPGRTHLQDAVPVTLGLEFGGYASQIQNAIGRLLVSRSDMLLLAVGGTAVGSGMNAHPDFAPAVIRLIAEESGSPFCETNNHFAAQAAQDPAVAMSGALKTLAVSLIKIANDVRWLGSGPRCGLGEIQLPALQPGSSSMPGKVNPVLPEAVLQAAAQVIGNDCTVTLAGQAGSFELNTMMPVMAYNLLQSIELLASVSALFARRCIDGITADRERCASMVEKSLSLAACLVPHIGYDEAAMVSRRAYETGKTIRETVLEEKIVSKEQAEKLFSGMLT